MKVFGKYFDSEWSFAKFKVFDTKSLCCFTPDNQLAIISTDGNYYLAEFDTTNGGDCKKLEERKILG
jgi:hypothetical protein